MDKMLKVHLLQKQTRKKGHNSVKDKSRKTKRKDNCKDIAGRQSYKEYTYFIKTKYYPDDFIDRQFKKRGNWRKVTDQELDDNKNQLDFVYLDDLYYTNPKYYSLHATIKNSANDDKRAIALKNNLMKNLIIHPKGKKYVLPQIELDLYSFINKSKIYLIKKIKALFKPDKVYIFKPVSGFGGSGIRVFSNWTLCMVYINNVILKYKSSWNNTKTALEKQNKRLWVLQEYLTDPLTFKKSDGQNYKFHIRHFYLYCPRPEKSYYKYNGRMAMAELPYVKGDWTNKNIHDTHFHNQPGELFPNALHLSSSALANINYQINDFYIVLNSIIKSQCYADSKYCFELFGVDFMLTRDLKLKIIEVNHGIGLGDSSILSKNKEEIFEGIMELVIDKHLPPKNKINTKLLEENIFISISE